MPSESTETLICVLSSDILHAIARNVELNNAHQSRISLVKYLMKLKKDKHGLLDIKVKGISSKKLGLIQKMSKNIQKNIISDLLIWAKKNKSKDFLKFINKTKKGIDHLYDKTTEKIDKKSKRKFIKFDSENDSENESLSDESDDDSDNESFSDSESDSNYESDYDSEDDSDYVNESETEESYDDSDDESEYESEEEEIYKKKKNHHKKRKSGSEKRKRESENKFKETYKKFKKPVLKSNLSGFKKLNEKQQNKVIEEMKRYGDNPNSNTPILYKILLSNIPENCKEDVLTKFHHSKEEESSKFPDWLDCLLTIPFGEYVPPPITNDASKSKLAGFMNSTKKCLNDAVHGHDEAKQKILQYVAQTITNPSSNGLVLGIEGPMGNGKTTLIEKGFAKAMKRPFATIPLGGIQDGSFFEGHGYTYDGSRCGAIVDVLIKTRCMNPVIYMDELDKVSQTHRGDEIINLLIHLIDPSQNNHFRDRYFSGIDIDLSQATFIFSYNDADSINPILMDRITKINTKGFRLPQKLLIAKDYLMSKILSDIGLDPSEVMFSDDILEWIITTYTNEGGVRCLQKLLYEVLRELNYRKMTTNSIEMPFKFTKKNIQKDFLKLKRPHIHDKIHSESIIGKINGLYATTNDTGGVLPIEASLMPSNEKLRLELTGHLGKVMLESVQVAKTLSWKLINEKVQTEWMNQWEKYCQGIHIHCPEGGVPKDGPSAGTAITVAIYSLLSKMKINNEIGITGEIDLSGKVLPIGGLESKLFGAKQAGCKLILIPKNNKKDFDRIKEEYPTLIDDNFKVKIVSTIQEVIKEVFPVTT